MNKRLTAVEQQVRAGTLTEEQAREIQHRVNLIARGIVKSRPFPAREGRRWSGRPRNRPGQLNQVLGFSWTGHRRRINRDAVLAEEILPVNVTFTELTRIRQISTLCLPLEF
jgi:hypothetical protein